MCFGIHKQNHSITNNGLLVRGEKQYASPVFRHLKKPHTPLPRTAISVLLISVRNHTVHFIGQFVLKARNRLSGSASYQVGSGALHFVQAHVTGFSNLPLGKVHKLWVPGVDAETLREQDLMLGLKKKAV